MSINVNNRGFTLIELLVVIAIIGILASVVLASLNSARQKGSDAVVKSNLNNARAQAELFYDNSNNQYTGVCTTAGTASGIQDLWQAADNTNGGGSADCDDNATSWAAEAELVSATGTYYCVDSTGKSTTTSGVKGASATSCP